MKEIKNLISKADLHYRGINRIPESGLPMGNGRMGTLVWMSPVELHMQINRVDVFACDATTRSFDQIDVDYSSGCGFIDVNFGGAIDGIFSDDTVQHLSVYDGRIAIDAGKVKIETYAIPDQDVFLIDITDEREQPLPITVHLRTLRGGSEYIAGSRPYVNPSLRTDGVYSFIKTNNHLATSILRKTESKISLTQRFEEEPYYCESLVEVEGYGRRSISWNRNSSESVLEFEAKNGRFTIAIATGQSFDRETPSNSVLSDSLEHRLSSFSADSLAWWHDFWERAPKFKLQSTDGVADQVASYSIYFLYVMASVSRGNYMARYGGLLFYNSGDFRIWGSQYWWHNQSCYYAPLVAAGCWELADAFYNHIWNAREAYQLAARQQWGSEGLYIPETCWFSGPCVMPEDVAKEMVQLYTNAKPWSERSDQFEDYAKGRNPFESRWNWLCKVTEKDSLENAPYSYVNHIFSATAKITYLFWLRYQMTGDRWWLEERAYPMLKDTADFYLHLPFVEEGEDGKLHLKRVNNHEDLWDANDPMTELVAIHGLFPIAIRAAEILGVDAEKREKWRAFEQRMAPILTNASSDAMVPRQEGEEEIWSSGARPVLRGEEIYYHSIEPLILYDLITLETPPSALRTIAENTYRKCLELHGYGTPEYRIGELDPFIIAPGRIGDADAIKKFVPMVMFDPVTELYCDPAGSAHTVILDNRLTLREGPQAFSGQRLGQAFESMVNALCNAVPPNPGGEPVLHLFAALPDDWDASIQLPASNGYWVEASKESGEVKSVQLKSSCDLPLMLRNPWHGREVMVDYGSRREAVSGELIRIQGNCTLIPC